jgi:basic membrane lipoprotein Med (substrate-binding protein (PBP1-ABC) superfamily)
MPLRGLIVSRHRAPALETLALAAGCTYGGRYGNTIRLWMVSDLGGLGDHSYNDSAYAGLLEARDRLGVAVALLQSRSAGYTAARAKSTPTFACSSRHRLHRARRVSPSD